MTKLVMTCGQKPQDDGSNNLSCFPISKLLANVK